MKQATIKNIASELKLSTSTISRALNDHPDINCETKRLVNSLAKELGYRPNIIARNLKSSKSKQIGVIVPEIRHDFFANALSGVEEVAYQKGYTVILAQSNEDKDREEINLNSMYLHRVAGVLVSISQTTTSSAHFKRLIDKGVKMVFFDRVCNDLNVSTVHIDDMQSSYDVVKYLVDKGYEKIIHFAGPQNLEICKNRRLGYEKALADSGVQYDPLVIEGGMHESDGYKHVDKMIELGFDNCAIFAVNDPVAVGAVKRLKELDIKIPQQVGIVGFSNNPITEMINPRLTTVEQPAFEMGRRAAEILISEIESESEISQPSDIILETKFIAREST
jgi:LacI family transcriptional regulator